MRTLSVVVWQAWSPVSSCKPAGSALSFQWEQFVHHVSPTSNTCYLMGECPGLSNHGRCMFAEMKDGDAPTLQTRCCG